jgi:uncharacterized protein with FMN-binding domain
VRRIAAWALGTVTVLILVLSYHTSTSSRFAASAAVVAARDRGERSDALTAAGPVDGDPVTTRFGVVQVRIVVADGRIASVQALQAPDRDRHDRMINERALPLLAAAAVAAQGSVIDSVSGATLTSQGYVQSLQSAIDRAHA